MSKLIYLDSAWHDKEENKTGKLSGLLSSDIEHVRMLNGALAGALIQAVGGLIVCLIVSFWASWQLTLTTLVMLPIFGILIMIGFRGYKEKMKSSNTAYKESVSFLTDASLNIKTICSLCHEEKMVDLYKETLKEPMKHVNSKACKGGVSGGLMMFSMFILYGVILFFGSRLLADGKITLEKIFISMFSLIFSLFGFGILAFVWPDMAKAFAALDKIFEVMDTPI